MDMLQELLTLPMAGSVGAETLELLGTKASNLFLEKKASLNSAITKLASEMGELNNEHIQRISEFANNVTFQRLFEKNADKHVHFDIADPAVIIRDLRDGGSPAHDGKTLRNKGDYLRPPVRGEEKEGGTNPEVDGLMADAFSRSSADGQFGQGEEIQKVASGLDPTWEGSANPINDVFAEHTRLQRVRQEVAANHEAADLMMKTARSELYRAVKTEVMAPDGAGLGGVIAAFEKLAGNHKHELTYMVEGFIKDGISADRLEQSMYKNAGKVLNPAHPLPQALAGFVKAASDKKTARTALVDIDQGLEKTAAFLKEHVR